MHFQFLGTGSAFTQKNFQTNFLIRANGKRLLVDCGGDIRHSLSKAGYTHRAIDQLYISHQHADHIGGLEWLAFNRYFDRGCPPPTLYIAEDHELDLWEDHLKISLQHLVGRRADKEDFFRWEELHIPLPNDEGLEPESFKFGHLVLQPVPVRHVPAEVRDLDMMAYGLRIQGPSEPKVFWSSDTIYDPDRLMAHYEWADWIIHDCETTMKEAVGEDGVLRTLPVKSNVHSHFSDLEQLPEEIKSKMYLVHYQDNVLSDHGHVSDEWETQAYVFGFNGFLESGDELVLSEPSVSEEEG